MVNRWIGIALLACMLSANAALFLRDVLPALTAGAPPTPVPYALKVGHEQWVQTAIYHEEDGLIGRSWTRVWRGDQLSTLESTTFLSGLRLPTIEVPAVRINFLLMYQNSDATQRVDELHMDITGLPFDVGLDGELVADQFPCVWKAGPHEGQFILDGDATRALGDAIRPFSRLPGLEVGQSWRLQLMNPFSKIIPGLRADNIGFDSIVVRVSRRETIEHAGRDVEALRVEAHNITAWVAPDGRVLRQTVDLPFVGRLTIKDEPFDETLWRSTNRTRAIQ